MHGRKNIKLAYKIQRPGKYPEESIQHSEHGESLKSRTMKDVCAHKRHTKRTGFEPNFVFSLILYQQSK